MTQLDWFLQMFPINFLIKVMMPETNKIFDSRRPDIMWWDYLCWLGIFILFLTTDGHLRRDFWKHPKKMRMFSFTVRQFVLITSCHFTASKKYPVCIEPLTLSIHHIKIGFIQWEIFRCMEQKYGGEFHVIMSHILWWKHVQVDDHVKLHRFRFCPWKS